MNDLLRTLRQDSVRLTTPADAKVPELNGDVEAAGQSRTAEPSEDAAMAEFFEEVADIRNSMEQIRETLHKLESAHEESKYVTNAAAMKDFKQRMEQDVDDVSNLAKNIKGKLEALDSANLANRMKSGCGEGTCIDRSRMSIIGTLKKKFKELMDEFQNLRQKIQDEYREIVERRAFTITGKTLDEETIDRLIETGESELIFQKAIQEQGRGQILDTIAELQERHDAVKDIEKKLLDLHQICLDMAVLVEAQSEMLDNIETQVVMSVEHVQVGTAALQHAKSVQRNSRKIKCISIIFLLIIVVIIVLVVVKPWKL